MPRDTLVDFFADFAPLRGVFLVHDNGYRTRSFRYCEVAGMARAFSLRLREHGIGKGEKVLFWSENRPGWIGALWGCILDGVVVVPVDYRSSAQTLTRIGGLVGARALVTGDEVSPPAEFTGPVWHMPEIERESAPALDPQVQGSPDDLVEIVFTSGATGEPKGVTITHRNLLANMVPVEREIARYKKYGRPFFPLRFVDLLPLSHLFGQAMATYIPPMLEGTVVFLATLHPQDVIGQIQRRRVSVLVCVPKILEMLRDYIRSQYPESAEPRSGRWWIRWWHYRRVHQAFGIKFWAFVVGAAPLDPGLEQFWSQLGFVVVQGYGLTETAPIVTLNHPFHARRGTVGRPIGGVEVKIAGDSEILVRGPNVTGGYYRNPEASSEVFADGWFHTGDLGTLAADGTLVVHGRKKDVIVTPDGLNVYPEDVERALEETSGVKEAAVLGHDAVHAVLVLEAGANADEAVRAANEKLEEHQRIRTVRVWPGAALPRTEGTAKLKRAEIRQWLESGTLPAPQPDGGLVDILRRMAPGRNITPQTTLEELGLSSLDRIELMVQMEQQAGGAVDERAFVGARRVSELLTVPVGPREVTAQDYPRWGRSSAARFLRRIVQSMLILPLTRFYARVEVRGIERLSGLRGPVIFASNHQSHLDTPAILSALPVRFRYRMAPAMSKEFFTAHFHPAGRPLGERFGSSLQYYLAVLCFNAFPLPQREAGAGGALRYAGELAADGWSILIFPEGERTQTGEILPFRPGVAMIASRLALSVIPIRLRGLEKVLHKSARWATRGPVQITFGNPVTLTAGDWRELAAQIEKAVRDL
ncbi:MAG: AMP-binding protein [Bryobacteraceae bacterium]